MPLSAIIKETFFKMYRVMDQEFYTRNKEIAMRCGAVVSSCLLVGNMLYCANLGDSRSVLCRNGRAINLSVDHKATLKSEVARIKALGGFVTQGRLAGKLMITRSFGDFEMKLRTDMDNIDHSVKLVSIEPDIRQIKVDFETDSFILLASDGIFDKFSS